MEPTAFAETPKELLPALAVFPAASGVLGTVLVVSALLMPMGLVARRVAKAPLADWLTWAGLLCMGLFSSLFVLTVLRDVGLLTFAALGGLGFAWAQQMLPGLRADTAVVAAIGAKCQCRPTWTIHRSRKA